MNKEWLAEQQIAERPDENIWYEWLSSPRITWDEVISKGFLVGRITSFIMCDAFESILENSSFTAHQKELESLIKALRHGFDQGPYRTRVHIGAAAVSIRIGTNTPITISLEEEGCRLATKHDALLLMYEEWRLHRKYWSTARSFLCSEMEEQEKIG